MTMNHTIMSGLEEKELNILVLGPEPPEALIPNLKGNGFRAVFADEAGKILIHLPDVILLSSRNDQLFTDE